MVWWLKNSSKITRNLILVLLCLQDIGLWYDALEVLNLMAAVTNGFVVGFTSEFIPKVLKKNGNEEQMKGK